MTLQAPAPRRPRASSLAAWLIVAQAFRVVAVLPSAAFVAGSSLLGFPIPTPFVPVNLGEVLIATTAVPVAMELVRGTAMGVRVARAWAGLAALVTVGGLAAHLLAAPSPPAQGPVAVVGFTLALNVATLLLLRQVAPGASPPRAARRPMEA